ncbi:MAG: hypothetical protein ACFCVK_11220 [Acidimicrobiales bacterium]
MSGGGSAVPRFATPVSHHPAAPVAVAEATGAIVDRLPSVTLVTVSGDHARAVEDIVDAVDALLVPQVLVGGHAVALWAATDLAATPVGMVGIGRIAPVVAGLPPSAPAGSVLAVLVELSTACRTSSTPSPPPTGGPPAGVCIWRWASMTRRPPNQGCRRPGGGRAGRRRARVAGCTGRAWRPGTVGRRADPDVGARPVHPRGP